MEQREGNQTGVVDAIFALIVDEETMLDAEGHRVDRGYLVIGEELSDVVWQFIAEVRSRLVGAGMGVGEDCSLEPL
jgi:hypothetical protein